MSDIETTDWLIRDVPKEQLEREKQESLFSADLQECITYDEWSAREYGHTTVEFDVTSEKMIAKGYIKQIEAEWIEHPHFNFEGGYSGANYECSNCHYDDCYEETPYCPKCGAKMKGVES